MTLSLTRERAALDALHEGRRSATDVMAELYPAIHGPVRRLCVALVGPVEADDAVQEVLLAIHRGLPRFREQARLMTWVRRITIRVALRQRDRWRRGQAQELAFEPVAEPSPDPAEADRLRVRLLAALRSLPSPQRTVLALAVVEGLPRAEIAAVLGIPPGTVWSRLHHARRRLAQALKLEAEI